MEKEVETLLVEIAGKPTKNPADRVVYKELASGICEYVAQATERAKEEGAKSELLKALPLMTDDSVAYSLVDSLEDNRGTLVWCDSLEEYIKARLDKLAPENRSAVVGWGDPSEGVPNGNDFV